MQVLKRRREGDGIETEYRFLRPLTEGAVALGLAQLLSALRFFTFAFGGTVSLGMVPVFVYAVRWGVGPGALLGTAYGLLGFLLRWDWSGPWAAVVLDQLAAFAVLGAAGLFRGRRYGVLYGAILGTVLRCACHVYSGIHFRAAEVPERFLNLTMSSPEEFFPLYDTLWMCFNLVPCLVLLGILWLPLRRFLLAEDLHGREDGGGP